MSIFTRILENITGRSVRGDKMGAQFDGWISSDDLEALARVTARAIRPEIKYAPPGERLNVITTGDFDLKGKLKDATRKRIEDLAKAAKR